MTTPPNHESYLPSPAVAGGKPSTESTVAAALGIAGCVLTLFSCCCGLLLILSVPMSIAGGVLGYLEREKVQRGEIDPASETWALVGMGSGVVTTLLAIVSGILLLIGVGGAAIQSYLTQMMSR